jgi:catechol-2,3-dioxygenase
MATLSFITLQVGDIENAKQWYLNVVGLRVEQEIPGQIAVLASNAGA